MGTCPFSSFAPENSNITIQIPGANNQVNRLCSAKYPVAKINGTPSQSGPRQSKATANAQMTSGGWIGPCFKKMKVHRDNKI